MNEEFKQKLLDKISFSEISENCKFLVVTIDDREFPKEEFYNLGKGIKEMVQKTFPNIEIIVIPKFVELIPFEEKEKFKEYINSKL